MLFLFASVQGFNKYLPILSALLEQGYTVSTSIISESKDVFFRTQSFIEEKRVMAWREVKDLNLDILFVEQEFVWLGIGHTHRECLLRPDTTLAEVMTEIQNHLHMH